ncbi:flagellar biosynthesis protein FliT [Izhakiella australiensis]|uniref:Flagellar protein FliT n=1 Tax=Izhakiella australiensis TaxID=1926881 RepID=A0A1S8YNX1_9GAMM|nr:flagella biosynthesis regulatory protein FliT [Izhakiella australiensis]OON40568.1 flagellar biosynthesis protein FliT [Izhakiella australiensis]
MTIAPHLLENYQKLLSFSQEMLRLANEGQWSELIQIEISYASTVEALARCTRDNPLSIKSLEQLRPVLRHLLDNEREIKQLLAKRKDELNRLINQSNRQQSLMSTYASNSGLVLVPRDI